MGKASVFAAAIATLALASCASNEPGTANTEGASRRPQQCFTASSARSFRAVDTRTVHFRVGRDVYRADVLGTCRDLGWTNRMSLVSSRNSQVCAGPGFGTSIVTRGPGGQQRCAINSIAVLTPEQVEALPAAQKP
jgi:hypothetical protein